MALNPVFGFSASGSINIAPVPMVLPFPGVPTLSGNIAASVGIPGIGVANAGLSVGPGGVMVRGSASATIPIPGVGSIGASVSAGPGGISGGATVNAGPFSGSIGIGPDGGLSGSLGGGVNVPGVGNISGGISISPDGTISGGLNSNVAIGPFSLSLNASLPPLMTKDSPGGLFRGPRWGIFDDSNQPIAPWETVTKVDYRREMRISDYPVEDGRFASYNKVAMPYDVRITFVVGSGGGVQRRTAFLLKLEDAVRSLAMFTVVTPEATYYRANVTHLEYARDARRGVNLLVVEIWVSEVRTADGPAFSKDGASGLPDGQDAKAPTGKPPQSTGKVQPKPAPFVSPSSSPDQPTFFSPSNTPDKPAVPSSLKPPTPAPQPLLPTQIPQQQEPTLMTPTPNSPDTGTLIPPNIPTWSSTTPPPTPPHTATPAPQPSVNLGDDITPEWANAPDNVHRKFVQTAVIQ